MVNQVTVIGILMIVNGALCVLYGLLLTFMGPFLSTFFNIQGAQAPPEAQQQMQQMQQMVDVISVVYIVLGASAAIAGIMNIAGGICALRFRSRGFVIAALFFNVIPIFTCYCAVTSLGLMIWGLIVMFQSDVAEAFKMGAEGYSADDIRHRLGAGRYRRDDYRRRDRDESRDESEARREEHPRTTQPPVGPEDERFTDRPPPPLPPGDEEDERFTQK